MTPVILECPCCRGSGREPDAPAAIADDDGTCRTCCRPDHPWYVARHGRVGVPLPTLADPALADVLARLAEQATFLPVATPCRGGQLSAGRGVNPGPASYDANMTPVILECPSCRGSGREPDAPAAIADDDGACLTCCRPDHPWYVAWHGQVGAPLPTLADPALVEVLARLAEAATFLPVTP